MTDRMSWNLKKILFNVFLIFIVFNGYCQENERWNLLLGMPVSASGFEEGFEPENAFINANSPLCWTIEGGGFQWYEVYFDAPSVIERFELTIGHEYKGEPIEIYGRTSEGSYELLHKFENEQLIGDTAISFTPPETWTDIEFIRIESPESPVILCWRDLGLIGFIPERTPPDDIRDYCRIAPDVIYHNGTVITMDTTKPYAEAVAIRRDKIIGVGTDEEMLDLKLAGCATKLIDLQGLTMMPGFNDAHNHIFSWPQHICYPTGDTTYPSLSERVNALPQLGWTSISELAFGQPDDGSIEHLNNAMELDLHGNLPFRLNGYWGTISDLSTFQVLTDSGHSPGRQYSGRVRAPGVKLYVDHPLGEYDLLSQEEMTDLAQRAHDDGWQITTHAVNTSGIEKVITAYETILGAESNDNYRHRIEHFVKVSDDQFSRALSKRIVASFQLLGPPDWPTQESHQMHISNTNPEWQMRWREFVDAGLPSAGSSDYPFNNAPCNFSPFRLVYEGVTRLGYIDRVHADWELNQRLNIEQCIKLLTIDGAYATKEDHLKGSITPGKWADLIIVSENPLDITTYENLLDIQVLQTMVGGRIEYCSDVAFGIFCTGDDAFALDGMSVIASDYYEEESLTPDLAFDSDNETSWSSGNFAPQWILIDMLNNYKITGIDLYVDQWPPGYTVHQILAKGNSILDDFDLLHEFAQETEPDDLLQYTAPSDIDLYRFVKILTTESPSWVSWQEIIIYKSSPLKVNYQPYEELNAPDIFNFKITPQPVNENTTLSYELNRKSDVHFRLISSNGTTLTNPIQEIQSTGKYSYNLLDLIDIDFPPGMYYLVGNTGKTTIIDKLIFSKSF